MNTLMTVAPFEQPLTHVPAVGTLATVVAPAPGAKNSIVIRSIVATLRAGVAAEQVDLVIRDGLTGAGAIKWRASLACAASGFDRLVISGLWLAGFTKGGPVTVEFASAPTGTGFQTVAVGYHATDQIAERQALGAVI